MTTKTQTGFQSVFLLLRDLPAISAGWTVFLFLFAALLPLSAFCVLVVLHILTSLTVTVPHAHKRSKHLQMILQDHLCEISMLAGTFAISLSIDPQLPWIASIGSSSTRIILTLIAVAAMLTLKIQLLRQGLTLRRHAHLGLAPSLFMLTVASAVIAMALLAIDGSISDVLVRHLLQLHL